MPIERKVEFRCPVCGHKKMYTEWNFPQNLVCDTCGVICDHQDNIIGNIRSSFINGHYRGLSPCLNCPNRPVKGEVKICNCTLPYQYGMYNRNWKGGNLTDGKKDD